MSGLLNEEGTHRLMERGKTDLHFMEYIEIDSAAK
jgi:hypothetical protein